MTLNKWWQYCILAVVVSGLSLAALVIIAATLIYPALPSIDALTDYRPKLPLRVYSEDGFLISEFGEERRAYIKIENVSQNMKNAVIAIEDRRFYQHNGIDIKGVMRAIVTNLKGGAKEGASTITMQVAKNFFTPPNGKRTIITKINEALLALKIEHGLSKDKILELYINQIFLGQRSYGFAAASQVYYGKPLEKINLAETALLAGLPKAPSAYNPFINPKRAIIRQKEVLHDMFRYGFIDQKTYEHALKLPLRFKAIKQSRDLSAEYVAEIVRESLYAQYQDEIYSSGLKVYTTIRKANQEAANAAVLEGILEYDLRHGYRGPEKLLDLDIDNLPFTDKNKVLDTALDEIEEFNGFVPAIITSLSPKAIVVYKKGGDEITINGKGLAFVEKMLNNKDATKRLLKVGAVVRVLNAKDGWRIVQLPQVESALIALDPQNGAIRALVGGFDFNRSKFNHVTQAWRQPGSSFKPFVYSAALEKGYTPATIVDDVPISISADETGDKAWIPQNYENSFEGPIRLRQALAKSINMVAIRMLQSIGPHYAQDYITRFGFAAKNHPAYLTMALGAGSATPWQMAAGYAVFANGGYRVKPNLIAKIVDHNGQVIAITQYDQANNGAPRVIDARNAFLMNSMMQTVVRSGTAAKASELGRDDIAGKTGTTNDHFDAWFAGYNPKQVAIAWIGFDQPKSLGKSETGGTAALPIWMKYMGAVLKGIPNVPMSMPEGISIIKINPATGTRVEDFEDGMTEYFYQENPPPRAQVVLPPLLEENDNSENTLNNQAQQVLQPEIILSPTEPSLPTSTNPAANESPARSIKPEQPSSGQNAAAKILNPH